MTNKSKKTNDKAAEMTALIMQSYTLTLPGSVIGYIITLMSDEQNTLDEMCRDNITDPRIAMAAAANNIAGNHLLTAVYNAAGAKFTAFAMGVEDSIMEKVMSSDFDPSTIAEEIKRSKARFQKGKGLN